MKKFLVLVCFVMLMGTASADVITLDNPEQLAVPTAPTMVWDYVYIDNQNKLMRVYYHWQNADGTRIKLDGKYTQQHWTCRDMDEIPAFDPLTCVDVDDPDDCCTGPGTGENCYPGEPALTCFTETFGFAIRPQDVGTKIGIGLRQLIWFKMRDDVLSAGNDGTFQ